MNTGKRDEDKNDIPDTSVNAPVDTGDDQYHKKYDQEGEGDTQAQEAPPQEAQAQAQQQAQQPPNGGGPNGQAQQPPQQGGGGSGSYSQSSSGGSVAGNLAKALIMSTPAGNVIEAFGRGRNLANNFDRAIHGDTHEQESQTAKIDQVLYMLSQQQYGNTQNPKGPDDRGE